MSVAEISRALEAEGRLATELAAYVGKWVAIRNHAVVSAADTLRDLLNRIDPAQVDRILEVTEAPGSSCLF
jgi:hypothetical protein